MPWLPPRAEGYAWDGGRAVEARTGPGAVAPGPGWRGYVAAVYAAEHAGRLITAGIGLTLVAALLWPAFHNGYLRLPAWELPFSVAAGLLALQLGLFVVAGLERLRACWPGAPLHCLEWDEAGVTHQAAAFRQRLPREEVLQVVWAPVTWHGGLSRFPLALGAEVALRLTHGRTLPVARGLDPGRLRALAEALARDLAAPMLEALPSPVERAPAALDRSLGATASPVASGYRARFSSWKTRETADGWEARLDDGIRLSSLGTLLFTAENLLLPPVFAYHLVHLGAMTAYHGPGALAAFWRAKSPAELALTAIVLGAYARRLLRASVARRVVLGPGSLRLEEGGRELATLPLRRIEQIRAEAFPAPALRVVADGREVLLADLPSALDAEAIAELLPPLIAQRRRTRPAEEAPAGS